MPSRKTSARSSTQPSRLLATVGMVVLLVIIGIIVNLQEPGPQEATPTQNPQNTAAPVSADALAAPESTLPSWLTVYFTDPNPPDEVDNGIDRYVMADLDQAAQTIDVASFDFNLPSLTEALVRAAKRGVRVRVVLDLEEGNAELKASDSPTGETYEALSLLEKAGIEVVNGGRSNGLMHNKMVIIDSQILFMGSWNLSYNDTFRNNNNLLRITNADLIANYQAKFDELFVDRRFGAQAEVGALHPELTINGLAVENYFSPPDEVMQKLVAYVQGAQKSIHFIAFTYTHADLSAAMIERAGAGVDVQGIIENRGASQGALVPLFCASLPVKVDGNKYTMHHKVIIIDGTTVITGSFNFTKSADNSNDDNILVIHDTALAALYEQEYQRLLGIAQAPDPADLDCNK